MSSMSTTEASKVTFHELSSDVTLSSLSPVRKPPEIGAELPLSASAVGTVSVATTTSSAVGMQSEGIISRAEVVSGAETVVSAAEEVSETETVVSGAEHVVSAAEAVSGTETVVSAAEHVVSAAEAVSGTETVVSGAETVAAPDRVLPTRILSARLNLYSKQNGMKRDKTKRFLKINTDRSHTSKLNEIRQKKKHNGK